ncbi:MAG TPA: ABC transporter ATP-binding protein [Pyrinomonadaceae bacterium]|nr:ABC transporter ATP-binding protein [Pyrinomonadaceae bacterium]
MSINLSHLSKSFGDTVVVEDLSLEINDGEFVVLLGPSGCGKTTTLRMIAGLESPTSGEIFIAGQPVKDLPPPRRDVAMVFQSYALYPHMTIAQNIGYPLRVRKLRDDQIRKQVRETARLLEIEALLQRKPRELSGGERQRVALARAIVRHPRAFLMDEPLSNLDAKLRLQMRMELKHLQQQLGTTTVYVTHDQAEAMTLGHRVAVMNKGRLQQFAPPREIYHRPANRFVAEFVGSPGMNFLEGRIDLARGELTAAEFALTLSNSQIETVRHCEENVTLGIRPEDVHVSLEPRAGWPPVVVYVSELMGNETIVSLQGQNGQRIIARTVGDFRADAGSTVWISFDLSKAHFFDSLTGARL